MLPANSAITSMIWVVASIVVACSLFLFTFLVLAWEFLRMRRKKRKDNIKREIIVAVETALRTRTRATTEEGKIITAEQVLGIDKSSYLRGVAPQETGESPGNLKISPVILGLGCQKLTATEDYVRKTVDPWMVELGPNPVMFPHLRTEQNDEYDSTMSNRSTHSCTDLEEFLVPFCDDSDELSEKKSFENPGSSSSRSSYSVDRSSITSTQSSILAPQGVFSKYDGKRASQEMNTRRSFHTNGDLLVLTSLIPERISLGKDSNVSKFEEQKKGTSRPIHSMDVGSQSKPFNPMMPHLAITPESDSLAALQEVSPELGDTNDPAYSCPQCKLTLRTAGQMNTHLNRQHRRRYTCEHCTSAFALKADLQRHILTVHRDTYRQGVRLWRCSNTGCNVPKKEFRRKDNYVRHVSRCSRELEARQKEYAIQM